MSAAKRAPAKRSPVKKTPAKRAPRKRGNGTASDGDGATSTTELRPLEVTLPPAPDVQPSELRNAGLFRKSWSDFKNTIREASRWKLLRYTPYGLVPILVFALFSIVGSFDGSIFSLVLPDIVRDLNINVVNVLTVLNLVGFVLIFINIGVAYILDRVRRVPFVAAGAFINGIASLLTPHARTPYTLGGSRLTDSISGTVGSQPQFSLISDYYPVENRGRAFAFSGTLAQAGGLFAPWLVALVALNHGWRTPYYFTGPLLILCGVLLIVVLREPVRGYMERRAAGLSEEEAKQPEPPVSFGQSWRTIWDVRTMRRLFISSIVGGVGSRMLIVLPLFLFQEYHLDVLDRGKLITVLGVFSLLGGFIAGGIVDSLMSRRPQRVLIFSGALTLVSGMALLAFAAKPPLWVLVALFAIFGFTGALIGPAQNVFFAQVIPANVRTLGGAAFGLADIPAVILFQLFIVHLPEWGFTGIIAGAVPFYVISAVIEMSAASLFERDMRSSISSQTATAEYKRAKAAGTVKLLVCRDIEVEYDGVQVLFGVDFEAEEGEIIALLGTNGAGKSTLLKAISGVHGASGGAVVYDGRDVTHVPAYEVAERGIVHMPGGRGIFPGLSVRENLELGTWTHRTVDEDYPYERGPLKDIEMDEVLDIFPALKGLMSRPAGALSGGEQQMVSLAQAFLQRPRLLLIDELSLGLSPVIVQQLLESVKAINERGVTIVVVEQSVNVALTLAERAIFMEKGEVKFSGKTKDLLARPDILRAVYVKGTGALTGQPGGASTRTVRRSADDRRTVLSVQDIKKSFGGVTAVDGVSFDLHDEEILGLIGPNGAGKTTIFDLISGFLLPDEGTVMYEGNDVTRMPADQRARLQLVRRFQDAKLFPSLTVYETLLIALDRRQDVKNMAIIALQLPQVRASERRVRRRADQLIELLGIGAYRDKFVKELSTGLRRVTDLACVLASEPRVLLLDEPSSGIAQAEAESLGPLLQRVRRETGCSILIIEHDMPLISRVADELVALDQGRVVMRDVPDVVLNDPRVVESYLGTSEAAIRRSGART